MSGVLKEDNLPVVAACLSLNVFLCMGKSETSPKKRTVYSDGSVPGIIYYQIKGNDIAIARHDAVLLLPEPVTKISLNAKKLFHNVAGLTW